MSTTSIACVVRGCGVLLLCGSTYAQNLRSGVDVSGTISAPGERDTYPFVVHVYDWFEIRVVDPNASVFSPRIEVYTPAGVLIGTSSGSSVAFMDATQVTGGLGSVYQPGTYTLVVSDPSGQTGAYDVHYVKAPGPTEGGELFDGVTLFGEIGLGDIDSFTYTDVAGQPRELRITSQWGGTIHFRVEHFDGNSRGTGTSGGSGGTYIRSGLGSGSTKTIWISDASPTATGTGRYTIFLQGGAVTPPYPPDIFCPTEFVNDPWILDSGGSTSFGPKIGDPTEPFNVSIDCTNADSPGITMLSISTGKQFAVSTRWGYLYLYGPRLFHTFGTHSRSIEPWFPEPDGLPVPNDLSLVGMPYTVQGICGGYGGKLRLSTAMTQIIVR